ncbi:4-hydroxy-tetrahydrodipicolinate synthase [Sphingopyxis sp. PAMC25046]|uniref:dihydrodipicolinate synthase family protein n=1 Tax=Sphingopyxis sp. PAMC25046 TaxID=2565556 RepID=UPI00109DE044|nr:dihydrodipicolinate synthase family protein [Sphingopyxis sp. PAMC25046]QCB55623.1 4-hydroxy-tetrahydrodipicolinate synthase [Sphingopyxis sp. PAMC25046]
MSSTRIEGSFVATVTPFDRRGEIDFGAWQALLDHQRQHGTRAILFMGSTGEPSLLLPEEKKRIVVETVKMRAAGMAFFYGCTGPSTEQVIENVRFAAANGADGAIIAAPPYICASEADIEQFYLEVADAVDLPLGIYNNPPRVKTDLHWEQLLRLFRHPNIVIHKESTARVGQMAQILAAAPDVSVMCCDSPNLGLVVPTMALGGHGTANMGGNIAPAEMAAISTPWTGAKEAETFRKQYLALLPLLHFNYSAINPVAIKSLMRACGLPVGGFRKPLRELGDSELEAGLRIIRNIGLAEKYRYSLG